MALTQVQGGMTSIPVSGTAVTASGTSVDFTGIPSWVKRITVMFNGVSTNGTSIPIIQLGDSGGIENTGYAGTISALSANTVTGQFSTGFLLNQSSAATAIYVGNVIITNLSGNVWTSSITLGRTDGAASSVGGGIKTLSDTLTQVRITTVNGTDTFDAGTINIMYE